MSQATPLGIPELLRTTSDLLRSARHVDGAKVLRRALDLAPTDTSVTAAVTHMATLARTWLTFGQVQLAVDALAPLAASHNANGSVLMLYGHALMATGHKKEAEAVFRGWLKKEPSSKDAALRLAAVLADSGGSAEAEPLARKVTARHGATPESAFVLGRALLGLARFNEAEDQFRHVVHARPDHQAAHANLMELVWMRSGDVREASRALDRALREQPQLVGLRITKSRLLLSARMPGEALAELDAGLAMAPRDVKLLTSAITVALELDGTRALGYAKRLRDCSPQDRMAQVAIGNASLATGDAAAALAIAEVLHRSDPCDGQALAMTADARRILGNQRYRELLDYQHFVRAELIDIPPGWTSLDAYLADLVADLERVHVLRAHPVGNSLREGTQIPLIPQDSPYASIRAFPQAIDGSIRRYIQAIGTGNDAMRGRNTGRYRISGMWSVRLRPHGFHVNHYHPEGWISSACYLHLPGAVERPGGEGWLKFGEPAFSTSPLLEPEYFIKPEPGLLALFPSYMWHGTVPFAGTPDDTRLTIAFDVVPVP
ncbi:MAG: 2OG-Fe(II) oxygenase family protein [Gammaproteobacteria bacterium]